MKEIMKRAWTIYRTLTTGSRLEKLSVALKQAWKEAKNMAITRMEAMKRFLESKGYQTEINGNEISGKRVIEVLYKDFKNDAGLKNCESVKGSYNAEKKTISLIDDMYIYINHSEKELENNESEKEYAVGKIKKHAEQLHRPFLLNAINY